MALPDAGNVEDYSEAEMNELLALFESDKSKLTKNQKAAVARYNFKKNKGEPIAFRGSPAQAGAAPGAPAAPPPGGSAGDITAMLSPEMQVLAGKDPATLTKEEKIALAKAKSQAVRAASAAAPPAEPAKPKGPTPEEIAAKKALETPQAKRLQERFGEALDGWAMMVNVPYATVKAERIVDVVRYLHMEMGFTYLRNQTATDYPPDRMEVVYNLLNMMTKEEVALRVKLPRHVPGAVVDHTHHKVGLADDMPSIPSIVRLHPGADWLERETFDLLGIQFTGHPYLVRLMMPDGWVGHPLRKDYDVTKEQFIGLDERGNDIVSFREEDGW